MQFNHKLIISLLITFISFNFSYYPALSAVSLSSLPANQDVPSGTSVTSLNDFKKIIDKATNNLQTSLTLNVNNTDLNYYSKVLKDYIGLSKYALKCTYNRHSAILTIQLTYKQAFKITKAISNPTAYAKLNNDDIKLLNTARNIVNEITNSSMSEYEKELAVHNYIINHTSYDYYNMTANTLSPSAYTAAGVLYNHKAVCEGYSEAIKLLLNLCNIECEIVAGQTADGNHAWNVVKIDGQWYMLDATFDDPVSIENGCRNEVLMYDYFNVTNKQLSKDHSWNITSYPIAVSSKYNYYNYSGLVANNYTDFKKIIIRQLDSGKTTALCYVTNYNPASYDLSFILKHYHSIKYSVPQGSEGCISITIV